MDNPLDLYIHSYYTGKDIQWDQAKNDRLKSERGASFEEIVLWRLLAVIVHPQRPAQRIILLLQGDYVWAVPCVVGETNVFLKTLFPNRKYTRLWLKGELI